MTRTLGKTAVLVLTLTVASMSLPGGDPDYEVGGVVVDSRSHKAIANVRVSLAETTARARKQEQVTKQDGRFSFAVSRPGKYELKIAKTGYPPQSFRQAGFAGVSSAIVVREDQDTRHLVFEANRGGAISGQIKDEDSEPVGNALVSIFRLVTVGGERQVTLRGQTRANAAGEFRLSNLPRGSYYVCAMGRPWFADALMQFQNMEESLDRMRAAMVQAQGVARPQPVDEQPAEPEQTVPVFSPEPALRGTAFLTTFYPHAQTLEEASLVHLEAGGEIQVSIALPLTKAVPVKGMLSLPGEMSEGRVNLLKKVGGQFAMFLQEWVQKEGTFVFKNVPSGSYQIVATSQSSSGASSWNVRQDIEVGTTDLEVTLRPPPMGAVSGHVLFESGRPASTADLFVSLHNERGNLLRAQVDAEGNFSFSRLPVGRYEVTAGAPNYVAAFVPDPSGERMPLIFDITSGEPIRRDVLLTQAVSVIEGTVEKSGIPQAGSFVLLMPKDRLQRWAYRLDQTDTDGSYRLATIPSGDYFLIALSDGEDVAYRDDKVAAILAKAAKPVHVEPSSHLDMKADLVDSATLRIPLP